MRKRIIILIAVAAALLGITAPAHAMTWSDCDKTTTVFGPTCSRAFIATTEPQTFVAESKTNWHTYGAVWELADGTQFLAGSSGCKMYGQRGDIRTVEDICDGRLTVKVRSVGAPQRVVFRWRIYN